MKYQIFLKGKPVAIEPSTYYGQLSEALDRMRCLETEQPELGPLQIRGSKERDGCVNSSSGSAGC